VYSDSGGLKNNKNIMKKVDYMKPSGWRKVVIKNKTYRTLSNGKRVPTWEAMQRELIKIMR
jgi:hypothetical protein